MSKQTTNNQTTNNKELLTGVGLYSLSDAARYINRSRSVVSDWAFGHRNIRNGYSDRTDSVFVKPLLVVDNESVVTFEHLIELRMVRLFRDNGVSLYTIKASARNLAHVLDTDHPFSSYRLKTDGKSIFADFTVASLKRDFKEDTDEEPKDEEKIVQDLQQLQVVMGDIVRMYFKDTEYQAKTASRWWLLGKGGRALLDPNRNFGQPIDAPTGVPLSALYSLIKAGETVKAVCDWYDVPAEAVETAINFYSTFSMKL